MSVLKNDVSTFDLSVFVSIHDDNWAGARRWLGYPMRLMMDTEEWYDVASVVSRYYIYSDVNDGRMLDAV